MEVDEREEGKITVENAQTKVESLITEELKVNVLNSRMVLAYTPSMGTVSLSLLDRSSTFVRTAGSREKLEQMG